MNITQYEWALLLILEYAFKVVLKFGLLGMIKCDCSYMQNRVVTPGQTIKLKGYFSEGSP